MHDLPAYDPDVDWMVAIPKVWSCPHCGTMNVDYPQLTVLPMCENCLEAFDWSQLQEISE